MTEQEKTNAFREVLSKICNRKDFKQNNQNIHTPYKLCGEMLTKLNESVLLTDKIILTFNLEFVEVLCYDCQVKKENIWFITDCSQKAKIIEHKRFNGVNVVCEDYLLWSETTSMKFDIIVGNPPFQKPDEKKKKGGASRSLWPDFVRKSLDILKDDGYLSIIHPIQWRKPEHKLWKVLTEYSMKYLELHNKPDGVKTFGVGTPYDWYVLKKTKSNEPTTVKDLDGNIHSMNLKDYPFLPQGMFDLLFSVTTLDKNNQIEFFYGYDYASTKENMSHKRDKNFKHPCIHSLNSDGPFIIYSSIKKDFFGKRKIIFTRSDKFYTLNDEKGEYGLSEHAWGINVENDDEYKLIWAAVNTEKWKHMWNYIKWTQYATEVKFFKYLRKDFWRWFVDEQGKEL